MKTRCLIVDDEPLARELIKGHVEKLENFEVIAEAGDAMRALDVLRQKPVDLMFLDIQMPQITGIDFLKTLKHPPKVIITTAYRQYALEGFELDVVDYLLKPITFERFLKAVNKYYQLSKEDVQIFSQGATGSPVEDGFIYVKENKKVIKIHLKDIIYIEGLSEYVQIHLENKRVVTKTSLTNLEEKLPGDKFLRIHKSYIVSVDKIEAFTTSTVDVPGKELPIGRSYKNAVHNSLNFNGTIGIY